MGHTTNEMKSNQILGQMGDLVPETIVLMKDRIDEESIKTRSILRMNTERQEQHAIIDQLGICLEEQNNLHKQVDNKFDQMINDFKKVV